MRYLEKIDFDILHSAESFAWWYLHKKSRKKVIFQGWGIEPFYGPESLSQRGLKKIYVKLFLQKPWKYVMDYSDAFACDGKFQLEKVLKLGVSKKKIFFLPNGINFSEIQLIGDKFNNKRKKLNLDKNNFIILSVCQIAPDKGIEDIINSFSIVKKEIKCWFRV